MMTSNVQDTPAIEADDLRRAIDDRELYLEYQPIMSLNTGRIKGLEALLRWDHPEKGTIPPVDFIPLAYESGLIIDAGHWVLSESCKALKSLEQRVGLEHDLFISVNVSSLDFADNGFLDYLYTVLSRTDLNPRKLRLELREECLMHNLDDVAATLAMCKKAGLGVTIDDFGTNAAFGGNLHAYPIDTVKIAPNLVRTMMSDQYAYDRVAAIAGHARHLNLTVSAVGVEHVEEAQVLYSMGCQLAQGYLYCPPVRANRLEDLFLAVKQEKVFA